MIKHRICHKESLNSRAEGFLLSWVSSKRLRGIADAEQPECMQSQRKQLFLTAPCDHSSPHMWFNSLSKLKLESGKSPISRSKKKKKKVLPPTCPPCTHKPTPLTHVLHQCRLRANWENSDGSAHLSEEVWDSKAWPSTSIRPYADCFVWCKPKSTTEEDDADADARSGSDGVRWERCEGRCTRNEALVTFGFFCCCLCCCCCGFGCYHFCFFCCCFYWSWLRWLPLLSL